MRMTWVGQAVSLYLLVLGFACDATVGVPGSLDTSYGTGGIVITPLVSGQDRINAVALQPDGKILFAGSCRGVTYSDFCALRYLANGSLDATFGSGGRVITPIGIDNDNVMATVLQPDGKVLLAGTCSGALTLDFCALRYLANGTLDASFGSGGKVITDVGSADDNVRAVILQPDGKVVLGGSCVVVNTTDFCAVRYMNDGTLDASFGTNGKAITSLGSSLETVTSMVLQADGKIVLAGDCGGNGFNADFCALRYLANGSLDANFGTNGKVTTPVGSNDDFSSALVLQPDGKLLHAGYCRIVDINYDFCTVRYNADGTLDTTFGTSGKVITAIGVDRDYASGIALQPDGKIILTGWCATSASNFDFCALRYNADGSLDATFGTSGKVVTPVGSGNTMDIASAVALQPDGKIVIAGYCNGSTLTACSLRYDGGPFGYQNCKLDVDGDNQVLATTDSLIHARIALGITGNAVVSGITFPPNATRNTWPLIRDYLVRHCGMSLVK